MKNNVRLLIVILCSQIFFSNSHAQNNNPFITKNFDEIKDPKGFETLDVIALDNNDIIRISTSGSSKFLLQLFSNELKLIKENLLVSKDIIPKKAKYMGIIKMKDKTYLLYRFRNKDILCHQVLEVFVNELKTGNQLIQLTESGELKACGMNDDNYYAFPIPYRHRYSADKSKYMLAFNDEKNNKNNRYSNERKDKFSVNVFDSNLNKLWNKELAMEYDNTQSQKLDIAVTNNSDILLLTKGYFNYKSFSSKEFPFQNPFISLLVFKKNVADPVIIEIPEGGDNIIDGQIHENENGDIFLAGGYSKHSTKTVIGNYIFNLDKKTYKITASKFYLFPADLLTSDSTGIYEKENLKTKAIYTTSDGSIRMLFEVIKKTTYNWASEVKSTREVFAGTISSRQVATTSTHENTAYFFNYGAILILSIKDNNLDWAKRISKVQFAQVTSALSFYSFCFNNEVNIFFNDDLSNKDMLNKGEFKRYRKYDDGFLAGVCVKNDGNISKFSLIEKLPLKVVDFKNGTSNNTLNVSQDKIIFIKKRE